MRAQKKKGHGRCKIEWCVSGVACCDYALKPNFAGRTFGSLAYCQKANGRSMFGRPHTVVGHDLPSDWRLQTYVLIDQLMATNSCGSITFLSGAPPSYRLLQMPASALVRDPFLRERGDSPYPAGSIGRRALSEPRMPCSPSVLL